MKNKFLGNISKVLFGNITTIISGVLIGLILPMLISVKDYGYYKTFTLYMSYIGCFAIGIIDGINLKYAGKKLAELNEKDFRLYFKVLLIMHIIISFIVIILSCIFLKSDIKIIFIIIGLFIIPNNLSGYFQQISQATQRFTEYAIRNVIKSIGNIFILLVMFILLKLNYSVSYIHYIVLFLIVNLILFIWYIITYKEIVFGKASDLKTNKEEIKEYIFTGFPLMLSNLCGTLILTIDRQFVSIIFIKEEYAIYAFAYNLLSLITVAISAISVVLFPMLKQEKKNNLSKKYDRYVSMIMIVIGMMLIAYFPLSKLILLILPKYKESLIYFKIIFPSLIGSTIITAIMHNYYKSLDKNFLFFKKTIVILILSIIANLIAYYSYQEMISFSIATVFVTFIWYIFTEKTLVKDLNVKWKKNLLYYLIITISFYFSIFITNDLIISTMLYLIFYIATTISFYNDIINNNFSKIIAKK